MIFLSLGSSGSTTGSSSKEERAERECWGWNTAFIAHFFIHAAPLVHINLAHKVFISRLVDYTVLPQTQYVSRQQGRLVSSVRSRWIWVETSCIYLLLWRNFWWWSTCSWHVTLSYEQVHSAVCTYVCNWLSNEFVLHLHVFRLAMYSICRPID